MTPVESAAIRRGRHTIPELRRLWNRCHSVLSFPPDQPQIKLKWPSSVGPCFKARAQPSAARAEADLLVWCPNFPFLMRGPSAIQEGIDLIPEREACLPLVGWQ